MIICAAIKFRIEKTGRDVILCGVRHANCFEQLVDLGFEPKEGYKQIAQGFVTHKGEFLDRHEAQAHAKESDQLAASIHSCWNPIKGELYSEDLW